jgi:hypothetical protein
LTERSDRAQTKLISEPKDLYTFLATPGIEVLNLAFASDDVAWLSWKYAAEERVPSWRHTNEVIGAYVTSGARNHQYRYLVRLEKRSFYCDTDSVIYVQPSDGSRLVETRDRLGDMTSELQLSESKGEYVSGGPQNYAYRVIPVISRSKTLCKVRGITLNYNTLQTVNFDVMKGMILRMEEPVNVHTEKKSNVRGLEGEQYR